jgi:hypothetical protein
MLIVTMSVKDTETEKEYTLGSKEEDWKDLESFLRSMDLLKRSTVRTILTIKEQNVQDYFKGQVP